MTDFVTYRTQGRLAILTLDRPDARNAVNGDVASAMEAAIDRMESDPEVWVGIITANTEGQERPVFCAGADLKAINSGNAAALATKKGGFAGFVYRDRTKPVIVAVDGLATAGGEVQALLTPASEVLPVLTAGKVRPIAVSSATRTTQYPDLPTIAETVPGYEFVSWMGVFVPAGTPRAVVEKLNAELKKAVADPGVAANLTAQSLDPMHMTTDEFAQLLKAEYDKYEKVVKISGARLD